MALLQISEPGQTPNPHERRIAIGIDLGTTHSLVAAVRLGRRIFVNLKDLIEKNGFEIKKVFAKHPTTLASITAPDVFIEDFARM